MVSGRSPLGNEQSRGVEVLPAAYLAASGRFASGRAWSFEDQGERSGKKHQHGNGDESRTIASRKVSQTSNPERSEAATEVANSVDERNSARRGSFWKRSGHQSPEGSEHRRRSG